MTTTLDLELATALRDRLQADQIGERDKGFATSLLANFDRFGSFTPRQRPHVERLARGARAANAAEVPTLSRLKGLFHAATTAGLRRPRLTFERPDGRLVVKPASAAGANPGAIYVERDGAYMGKVIDGLYTPSREADADTAAGVAAFLRELAADPAATARLHGRRTGVCCFCARTLTDPVSVADGYGPICADHYGVPRGEHGAADLDVEVTA